MLIDFDTIPKLQSTTMEVMNNLGKDVQQVPIASTRKYKKYGQDQIGRFIRKMQEEGLSVKQAAEQSGIPRSSAYKLLDEFNNSDVTALPGHIPKN
ncbi:hypothetical protein CLU79DRAFT_741837, partial [Phycomyces nitens]